MYSKYRTYLINGYYYSMSNIHCLERVLKGLLDLLIFIIFIFFFHYLIYPKIGIFMRYSPISFQKWDGFWSIFIHKKYFQVSVCHIFVIKSTIHVHFMHDHKIKSWKLFHPGGGGGSRGVKTVCLSCGFPNFHFLANLHYNVLLLDLCLFNWFVSNDKNNYNL